MASDSALLESTGLGLTVPPYLNRETVEAEPSKAPGRTWHDIGHLSWRYAYSPVDGWLPYFHSRRDGWNCSWMIEWRRLWLAWDRTR